MIKKLVFILFMLLALVGCGKAENITVNYGTANETLQTNESTEDEKVEQTANKDESGVVEQEETSEEEERKLDEERTQAVKDDMYENYGTPGYETSWYPLIKDIRVYEKSIYIDTSIYPDDEGKKTAELICNTVAYSNHVTRDDNVTVNSQNGLPIATCYRMN